MPFYGFCTGVILLFHVLSLRPANCRTLLLIHFIFPYVVLVVNPTSRKTVSVHFPSFVHLCANWRAFTAQRHAMHHARAHVQCMQDAPGNGLLQRGAAVRA